MWDYYPIRQSRHIRLVKTLVKDWLILGFLSAFNQAPIQLTRLSISQWRETNRPNLRKYSTNFNRILNFYYFFLPFRLGGISYELTRGYLVLLGKIG